LECDGKEGGGGGALSAGLDRDLAAPEAPMFFIIDSGVMLAIEYCTKYCYKVIIYCIYM